MKLPPIPARRIGGLASLSLMTVSTLLYPVPGSAQELPTGIDQAQPIDPNNPNVVRPQAEGVILLSLPGGKQLMQAASGAVSAQNYPLAVTKLQEARQVFNQLSNFHQELASSFSGIDNRIASSHRTKALEAAQFRDESTYQLALVHRAQGKPELAVPLLVQIIRSQQPTRELGKKSYQQLFELGFADSPYPSAPTQQSQSTTP